MTKPLPSWERQHQNRTDQYAHLVETLFDSLIAEVVAMTGTLNIDPNKPFSFARYPQLKDRLDQALSVFAANANTLIGQGVGSAWELANAKNDAFLESLVKEVGITEQPAYRNRNLEALQAFQSRKVGGMTTSGRVWKVTQQAKTELELGLDVGLATGKSAAQLARELTQNLQEPDRLFRRVRDKRGQLHLSKAAKAYHPGQGVYRSSYKNAMRLTRTEINSAYREADHLRIKSLPFVVGIEVRRSNRLSECPVCNRLKGRYPKDFVFRGWHPNCRCYTTTILATPEEMREMNKAILAGQEPDTVASVNRVREPHAGWGEWIQENKERLDKAPTKPLFIQDNKGFVQAVLPPALPAKSVIRLDGKTALEKARKQKFKLFATKADDFITAYDALMQGYDFAQMDKEITATFKQVGLTIKSRKLMADAKYLNVSFYYEFTDGVSPGTYELNRSFRREQKGVDAGRVVVEHDLFKLPKPLQGKGLSKPVFQALYKQYQAANLDLLMVDAGLDVGGYTWARYGFSLTPKSNRNMVLDWATRKLSPEELSDFMVFWNTAKDLPLFPMQQLARLPFGKTLLMNTSWSGRLDLKDPLQRANFELYLFGR